MKKIIVYKLGFSALCPAILVTSLMILLSTPALATCDYPTRCATYTPTRMSKTSQFFSNATGSTFLVEKIAQGIIQRELKQATNQNFKAEVKAFSVADTIGGKFKSLTITGNNVLVEGIKFSSLTIKTVCEYNHIDVRSHPLKFNENVVLDFSMEFSGEDLKTTAQDPRYYQLINKADMKEIGIASYKINQQTIGIENDKLCFTMNAKPTGPYKPIDIVTSTDLKIEDGKIVSSHVNLVNVASDFDFTELSNLPQKIKTLNCKLNLFGNKNTEVQVQKVYVQNDKLFVSGMAFIPKSASLQPESPAISPKTASAVPSKQLTSETPTNHKPKAFTFKTQRQNSFGTKFPVSVTSFPKSLPSQSSSAHSE